MLREACPIVASYGGKDLGAKRRVHRLQSTLTRYNIDHDVKLYPNAGHSFLNDAATGPVLLRPLLKVANVRPEPEAAKDAWARIEAFFAEHLAS
jgi:carboxymethylenebutenolidase